jgi:hypothetical protein
MFRGASAIVLALAIVIGGASARDAAAQHAGHHNPGEDLPIAVNGAATPERIPDWMAYRHFISMNALARDAAPAAQTRRDERLVRAGLSLHDRLALVRALTGKREALDEIAHRRAQVTQNTPEANAHRRAMGLEEKRLYDAASQDVLAALSSQGAGQLARHIQDMKKHIVVRGAMPQF